MLAWRDTILRGSKSTRAEQRVAAEGLRLKGDVSGWHLACVGWRNLAGGFPLKLVFA